MRPSLEWTSHIKDPVKKKEFEDLLFNSTTILNRLSDVLRSKGLSLARVEGNMEEYDNPSWAFKQAHVNGRKQELKTVLQLITFDRGES